MSRKLQTHRTLAAPAVKSLKPKAQPASHRCAGWAREWGKSSRLLWRDRADLCEELPTQPVAGAGLVSEADVDRTRERVRALKAPVVLVDAERAAEAIEDAVNAKGANTENARM